ncbi:MAG: hypothetical protein R3234_05890 [Thermoanaerobaculia bacterium]|nr:hypothetical protein [Thermoanaerobaculia bacterium]
MAFRTVLVGLLSITLAGCSNLVRPPETQGDPAEVLLLDHGRHASLGLPRDAEIVRYAYGDWRWFALGRRGIREVVRILSGGTEAGLGREIRPDPGDRSSLRRRLRVPVQQAFSITVPRSRVASLTRELEELYRQRLETAVVNPDYGLTFVRHPEGYGLMHNSNHQVAAWLRALGCEVDVRTPFSRWRIGSRAPTAGSETDRDPTNGGS